MSKLSQIAALIGMSAVLSVPECNYNSSQGYAKSILPKKDYSRRKKRNQMARKSRKINRK